MKNIFKLYRYISDERNRLIYTALTSAALGSTSIVVPLVFRYVINQLSAIAAGHPPANVGRHILFVLIALAILNMLDNLFGFIQERITDRVSVDIEVKLRRRIFEHMMELSIDFYEQTKVGETMTKVSNALFQFINWLEGLASNTLTLIIQMFLALILLTYINPIVGLVTTVLTALGIGVQVIRIRRTREVRIKVRKQDEIAYGHFNETIAHIATVRSSMPSSVPVGRLAGYLAEYRRLTYRMNNIQQYGNFARGTINDVAIVAAVAIIAFEALHHRASPGDVVAVALYLQQLMSSAGPLGRLIVNTSEVESSVSRITDLLETPPTVVDDPDAMELTALHSLEFKNVSFSYPGKKYKVLSNISFSLRTGQMLALVGPSGTGKTTITKLMLRFYEPTSGQILINGEPIEHFTAESVREHIGMVMQDVALFNDTVEANLQLARPDTSITAVKTAAAQAHADVFIEKLPEKYQTFVGERGVKLSGGEKQRIAIARAILKGPSLIVLDEATSALDSESEHHVQAGLAKLMADRTAVVIAHRLSTVMRADQILVLRDGKIVERGVHDELAKRGGGLYAKLFKLQTEGVLQG
jgi:ABC-type multidrug transport system fused ATPase/permease subunit